MHHTNLQNDTWGLWRFSVSQIMVIPKGLTVCKNTTMPVLNWDFIIKDRSLNTEVSQKSTQKLVSALWLTPPTGTQTVIKNPQYLTGTIPTQTEKKQQKNNNNTQVRCVDF